jgi:DNA-binding NarL/FixJ family response regulator
MLELYKNKYNFLIDVADTGAEAVAKALKDNYDLIIMDYQMPLMNGVVATKKILSNTPNAKVLAISNYDEYANITSMINAGAKGFILKNINSDELILAITTVLNNKNYYSSDVAVKFIHNNQNTKEIDNTSVLKTLTKREIEILKLITMEYTNVKIAEKLKLSKRTIDKHRQHLLEKLNTNNTVGLIKKAMELNYFKTK